MAKARNTRRSGPDWKRLLAAILVPVLFVADVGCGGDQTPPDAAPGDGGATVDSSRARTASRDSVRAFWRFYREATRLRQAGDLARAAETYERALEQNGSHGDALYYSGNVNYEMGNWAGAAEAWRRLEAEDPGSLRAHARLGDLALCHPEIDYFDLRAARLEFEWADRLVPGETGPAMRLAAVAMLSGDDQTAERIVRKVSAADAGHLESRFLRLFVDWRAGDAADALADLNRTLSSLADRDAAPIPAEGDTRSGPGPALAGGARCPLIDDFYDAMRELKRPMEMSAADALFRSFERRIASLPR